MAGRIVAPELFTVMGSVVDWAAVAEATQQSRPAAEIAKERGLGSAAGLQLRWAFKPEIGFPRLPFTVWVRGRKSVTDGATELKPTSVVVGGMQLLILDVPCAEVVVALDSGPGGLCLASTGVPLGSRIVDTAPVGAGAAVVILRGPQIRTVSVPLGSVVNAAIGQTHAVADDPEWKEIEIVGLPGDGRSATGTDLLADQGLVTALTDPVTASLDRYRRGAAFYGWDAELEPGVPAPPWVLADPVAIIKLFHAEMLGDFVDLVDTAAPGDQHRRDYQRPVATPSGRTATATFNPLRMLIYSALTDPLNALVTGFGTALQSVMLAELLPRLDTGALTHVPAATERSVLDVMVTSTWVDSAGKDAEYAALLLGAQHLSLPPATPAAVTASSRGHEAPTVLDGPFRAVVELAWTVPTAMLPFHLGSHALARRAQTPTGPAVTLLQKRPNDVAVQPIGETFDPLTPTRRTGSDTTYPIDGSAVPNVVRYAVANEDILGRWSRWAGASVSVAEPPAGTVTMAGARLDTTVVPGPCAAMLTVDVTWNWASRSVRTIEVVGRLYPQTWASDPPTDLSVPGIPGAIRTIGVGLLASITFDADGTITAATSGPGMSATAQHLSLDGMTIVATPLAGRGARRYRVAIAGFDLDFTAAGRWGLALWARGTEGVTPYRQGPWTTTPVVTSAADPRPPVITSAYEAVLLASLRDADGLHHARLTWTPMAGAGAYRVYTVSEATFRAMRGLPEPRPSDTLTTRLATLRAAFQADPDRRPFTRLGAEAVTGTSLPVTLPRGTKDLHLYVVLGVSAGEVESAWPASSDPLCGRRFVAFAAPQTVAPGPPELEISRVGPATIAPYAFHATVRIRSAAGATVSKIDLHRVRVPGAATELDTMGPPIATITGSSGGFTVVPTPAGDASSPSAGGTAQTVGTVTGVDAVDGSWRPVFYRAVAWGTDDPDRGQCGVRSLPSVVRQVVVPPAGDPPLTALTFVLPVAGSAQVRVDCATTAPVAPTLLGPHQVEAEVVARDAAGVTTTLDLAVAAATLNELPTTAPGAGASGLWRDDPAAGTSALHLLVRRAAFGTELRVRIRVTDPIGRLTEQVLTVPAGTPVIPPDILDPELTETTSGTVLTFVTSVPNSVDGLGDYVLEAALRRSPGVRRVVSATMPFADIAVLRRREDLLDPANEPLPIRRSGRTAGRTTIYIGVRAPGELRVSVVAPDGTRATISRLVGRRRFP